MAQEPPSVAGGVADTSEVSPKTALATVRHQLNKAASYLDIDKNIVERLNRPVAVHEVTIPLEHDDGTVEMFQGYRAQHDRVRDPAKAEFETRGCT